MSKADRQRMRLLKKLMAHKLKANEIKLASARATLERYRRTLEKNQQAANANPDIADGDPANIHFQLRYRQALFKKNIAINQARSRQTVVEEKLKASVRQDLQKKLRIDEM